MGFFERGFGAEGGEEVGLATFPFARLNPAVLFF
jgi:hypothetical protein